MNLHETLTAAFHRSCGPGSVCMRQGDTRVPPPLAAPAWPVSDSAILAPDRPRRRSSALLLVPRGLGRHLRLPRHDRRGGQRPPDQPAHDGVLPEDPRGAPGRRRQYLPEVRANLGRRCAAMPRSTRGVGPAQRAQHRRASSAPAPRSPRRSLGVAARSRICSKVSARRTSTRCRCRSSRSAACAALLLLAGLGTSLARVRSRRPARYTLTSPPG